MTSRTTEWRQPRAEAGECRGSVPVGVIGSAHGRAAESITVPAADRAPGPVPEGGSVTLVPLLEPRVTAVVVAVALPETRFVVIEQGEPGDPFRALPEVQVRHQQPHRAAMIDRQRVALVGPDHPRSPSGDIGQ